MNHHELPSAWKKRIALFLISQNLSLFGSSVVGFAILWHITLETSSGVWMMLATVCSLLPQVFVSLFGGVWADRYNRKYLIMLADGFISLATLALAISFLLGFRRLELLLVASVIRSLGAGIQMPAVSAIYPQLVPEEQLTKIQGINQTLGSVLMLFSPAVGGILLGTAGIIGAFFVDIVTAALAILVMSRIHVEKGPIVHAAKSMWKDIGDGFSYIFGHQQLRRIIICCMFSFFLFTPAAVLTPLMIERTFGNDVWLLTANEIAWSAASIVGGIFVSLKGQFQDKARTMAICIVGFGVMFGLLGISWNFISYLIFMGIAGFFMPVVVTVQTVYIQEITSPEVLGRVFSVIQLIISAAMPIAILLFGPLADVVSVESILLISGVLLALVGVLYGLSEKRIGLEGIDVQQE
ncbi:MAG: MFS transporter [Myxococcales bacterium]|jgi:DHA3 family macrolide efflux protein-like MFS transporter|nr:MFS transporter [Myxococcales bacterium]